MDRGPVEDEPALIADFTVNAPLPPQECFRCHQLEEYEVWKVNTIVDRKAGGTGIARHMCRACYEHYRKKATTIANPQRLQNAGGAGARAASHEPGTTPQPQANFSNMVAHIHQSTGAARRPDLGYTKIQVAPFPAPMMHHASWAASGQIDATRSFAFAATGQRPALAHNPYSPPVPPGPSHSALIPTPPPHGLYQVPALESAQVLRPGMWQGYGYTPEHKHYSGEVKKYAQQQRQGVSTPTFPVKFQLFYLLEEADRRGAFCEPLKNVVETVMVTPSMSGAELARRGREVVADVLKKPSRSAEFHGFVFDLENAEVRDPKSWTDLERLSDSDAFKNGYFYSAVMVPGKVSKKGGLNAAKPVLEFKPPKDRDTPVLGVMVPYKEYLEYLNWVARFEDTASDPEISTAQRKKPQPKRQRSQKAVNLPPRSLESDPNKNNKLELKHGSLSHSASAVQSFKKQRLENEQVLLSASSGAGSAPQPPQPPKPKPRPRWRQVKPVPEQEHQDISGGEQEESLDLEIVGHIQPSSRVSQPLRTSDSAKYSNRSAEGSNFAQTIAANGILPLDREQFRNAMKTGGSSRIDPKHLASLTSRLTDSIIVYLVPTPTMHDLLERWNKPDQPESSYFWTLFEEMEVYHGTISIAVHEYQQGSFKTAHEATILSGPQALFDHFSGAKVVAKRPYQYEEGALTRLPVTDELIDIGNECNILVWASALLNLVYDYMDSVVFQKKMKPSFSCPQLAFVRAGFSHTVSPNGSSTANKASIKALRSQKGISPSIRLGYLLEEKIEGNFTKYIHNGEPRPLLAPGDPEYPVAEFLCFTQHVQYMKTGKLAFVSDYQGYGNLLTDPQILTHHDLSVSTFGKGNIAEGFIDFEAKHQCNRYCKWFELAPFVAEDTVDK